MAILLPLALAFLMCVVGLKLEAGHLWAAFRRPRPLLIGLVVQVGLLPIFAVLLGYAFRLEPSVFLGLLIIAIAPGGITSNYVALLARADVALSTAMTLVTSLVAGVTIPLVLGSGLVPIAVPAMTGAAALLRMAAAMSAVTAVPLLLGMAAQRCLPNAVARAEPFLAKLAKVVFASVVLATFWQNRTALASEFTSAGPACVLLNLAAMAAGLSTRWVAGLSAPQSLAIAIEAGLQNAAVAIFVATVMLKAPSLAVPALIYAVMMNVTAIGLVYLRGHGLIWNAAR